MQDKKKSMASILVAKLKKPGEITEAPMKDGAEQDNEIALRSAADEILSAIESKDADMLVGALKSFQEMCSENEPEESEEYE